LAVAQLQGLQAVGAAVCPIVQAAISMRQRIERIEVAALALQGFFGMRNGFMPQAAFHRRRGRIAQRRHRLRNQLVRPQRFLHGLRILCRRHRLLEGAGNAVELLLGFELLRREAFRFHTQAFGLPRLSDGLGLTFRQTTSVYQNRFH
jgi:hypothetical protein